MNKNIGTIFKNLKNEDDIFYKEVKSKISYPENGNKTCFNLEDSSFWFEHRNNCIFEIVKHFYKPGKFLFDIGGGNGFVSKYLQTKGIETIMLEPGKDGVINSKKRGVKNIICSTLQNLDIQKNIIPYAGLFDVLEHIKDEEEFLSLIYNFLEDNGYLFITVPAFNFLWSEADSHAGHFRRYTLNYLEKILIKQSFQKVYSTYFFSFLPFPIFLFRTVPYKLKIRKYNKNISKKGHMRKSGFFKKMLELILRTELNKLSEKKYIPVGGSCFMVVKK